MRLSRNCLSPLLIMALAVCAAAAEPALAQKPERVTSVEGITEYRLANGLSVLLFPDQTKQTSTVNITYLVGSRNENYGETGMALAQNLYLARTLAWDADLEKKVQTLTAAEILSAMRRHIDPEKITTMKAGDFGKAAPAAPR